MRQRQLLQDEVRGRTGHGVAVTALGRRNSFYQSLEKGVAEF